MGCSCKANQAQFWFGARRATQQARRKKEETEGYHGEKSNENCGKIEKQRARI